MAQVCPDFRGDIYVRLNPDIVSQCGNGSNELQAQLHWLTKGRFEKRRHQPPPMDKEFVYLYTNEANRARCMQVAKQLEKWNIPHLVTAKCPLQKTNLCILFTLENIEGAYPFYYILNLHYNESAEANEAHAIGNLSNPTLTLQECLVCAGFLNVSVLKKLSFQMNTHTIYAVNNVNNIDSVVTIPKIKHLSSYVSDALTLKYIITNAKQQQLSFVAAAATVTVVTTNNNNNKMPKVLNFLSLLDKDTWDICIALTNSNSNCSNKDPPPELMEVIQLDADLLLWRTMATCVKNMNWALCVYNGKTYDNIIHQWDYHRHHTIEEYLGTQPLSVLVIDGVC